MKFHGKNRRIAVKKTTTTSWGNVADWYEEHLQSGDTHHERVIAPNVLRLLEPLRGKPLLEIGCGEGYFTRVLRAEGHSVVGSDIAKPLIQKARAKDPQGAYHVATAEKLTFAADGIFAGVLAVLMLQNVEHVEMTLREVSRVLAPRGVMLMILNHPTFRIPKRSSWGFDAAQGVQFRRLDGYLSASVSAIDMHPGAKGAREVTYSHHRSLQDYAKALRTAGFVITKIEEWVSHRESGAGPRKAAEDTARKEFPLFLMIEAMKLPTSSMGHLT